VGHELGTVANSKHRDLAIKAAEVGVRGPLFERGIRRSAENYRLKIGLPILGNVVKRMDFAVHIEFAHATGNKLGILRTKVED
jgi:hypothetical protein